MNHVTVRRSVSARRTGSSAVEPNLYLSLSLAHPGSLGPPAHRTPITLTPTTPLFFHYLASGSPHVLSLPNPHLPVALSRFPVFHVALPAIVGYHSITRILPFTARSFYKDCQLRRQ